MNSRLNIEDGYFWSLEIYRKHHPGKPIRGVLYDRVSKSDNEDNMKARKPGLLAECQREGIEVIAYFAEIANGRSDRLSKRKILREAYRFAEENNAVLVVPSVNRLIRAAVEEKDAPLRLSDLQNQDDFLEELGSGWMDVISLTPPGSSREIVRGRLVAFGQVGKENTGGRPRNPGYMARRKRKFYPIAMEKREQGFSYREIPEEILREHNARIPHITVFYWINPKKRNRRNC